MRFEICVISTLVPSDSEYMALIMSQLRIACGYNEAAGSCSYPRPVITIGSVDRGMTLEDRRG